MNYQIWQQLIHIPNDSTTYFTLFYQEFTGVWLLCINKNKGTFFFYVVQLSCNQGSYWILKPITPLNGHAHTHTIYRTSRECLVETQYTQKNLTQERRLKFNFKSFVLAIIRYYSLLKVQKKFIGCVFAYIKNILFYIVDITYFYFLFMFLVLYPQNFLFPISVTTQDRRITTCAIYSFTQITYKYIKLKIVKYHSNL